MNYSPTIQVPLLDSRKVSVSRLLWNVIQMREDELDGMKKINQEKEMRNVELRTLTIKNQ